jgi:hypothetical protein
LSSTFSKKNRPFRKKFYSFAVLLLRNKFLWGYPCENSTHLRGRRLLLLKPLTWHFSTNAFDRALFAIGLLYTKFGNHCQCSEEFHKHFCSSFLYLYYIKKILKNQKDRRASCGNRKNALVTPLLPFIFCGGIFISNSARGASSRAAQNKKRGVSLSFFTFSEQTAQP